MITFTKHNSAPKEGNVYVSLFWCGIVFCKGDHNNNDNNRIYNEILDRDWFSARLLLLGSSGNDDSNAKDDGWKKMGLNFTFEFRNYLDLFSPPVGLKTAQIKYVTREKIPKISHRGSSSAKHPGLNHFTLLLCRGQLRNIQLRILM